MIHSNNKNYNGEKEISVFKYKLEDYKIPEDASDMSMIFNLYAYPSQSSGSAVSTFTRTTNFAKDDYIEKFNSFVVANFALIHTKSFSQFGAEFIRPFVRGEK